MKTRTAVALACTVILGAAPGLAWSGPATPRGQVADAGLRSDAAVVLAERALGDRAAELGVDASSFRFESVRHSLIGTHVRGREHRGGIAVDGTWAVVHLLADGDVEVAARGADGLPGAPSATPVPEAVATTSALGALGSSTSHVGARRLLVRHADRLVDVWRVAAVSADPPFAGYVDVDATTGAAGRPTPSAHRAEGTAKVFNPNPVVTLRSHALRQPYTPEGFPDVDLDSPELTGARSTLPLRDVDTSALSQSRLAGPYVNVLMPGLLPVGGLDFDVTRSDPKFEGLMAYAHLDALQRYLQSLGFSGSRAINAEPQDVLATRLEQFDNSLYSQDLDLLVFGTGGVDDAEDGEIVVHEYGHALQHSQVPRWPAVGQMGAMGEGFGDILAAAYFARSASRGFGDVCMFDWDSTSLIGRAEPRCARRLDSPKRFPADSTGSVHDDGEIWGSMLWRIRVRLGRSEAERSDHLLRLVLTSHYLMTPTGTLAEGVTALRRTAVSLGRADWATIVHEEARRSGFVE